MSDTKEPLTPAEASRYEAPARRMLWFGLAGFVALIVILIIIGMETRIRTTLAEPQPSVTLDTGLTSVVQDMAPLPQRLRRIEVRTASDGESRPFYHVVLRDREDRTFYHAAFQAHSIEVVRGGDRDGSAINFVAYLEVDADGRVTGHYRQDRGVHAERYQAVLNSLVRQALVGHETHVVMSAPPHPDTQWTQDQLGASWRVIMD